MATIENISGPVFDVEIPKTPGTEFFTEPVQPVTPLSFEYKKEMPFDEWAKQQDEAIEEARRTRKLEIFNQFAKGEQLSNDWSTPEALANSAANEYLNRIEYGVYAPLEGRAQKVNKRWEDYWHKKERERLAKMPDAYIVREIEQGGPDNNSFSLISDAFTDSFADHFTFGFVEGVHPIYGKKHREVHKGADTVGALMGEVANFMALSVGAGAIGAPAVVANIIRKSKGAGRLLEMAGYIPYHAAKFKRAGAFFKAASNNIGRQLAPSALKQMGQQGANQIFMGLLNVTREKTRHLVSKYIREDEMSQNDYKKGLPAGIENFLAGYSLSLINSPASWSARFAGDTLWSTAAQSYRILTGQQNGWDMKQFVSDWLIGHTLGEVQGKLWSKLTPDGKIKVFKEQPNIKQNYDIAKENPVSVKHGLSDDTLMEAAVTVDMHEAMKRLNNGGIGFTPQERINAVNTVLIPHIRSHETKTYLNNDFVGKVDTTEPQIAMKFAEERMVRELGARMGWSEKRIERAINADIYGDRKNFTRFLAEEKIPVSLRVKRPTVDLNKQRNLKIERIKQDVQDLRSELLFYEKQKTVDAPEYAPNKEQIAKYESDIKEYNDLIVKKNDEIKQLKQQIDKGPIESVDTPQQLKKLSDLMEGDLRIQLRDAYQRLVKIDKPLKAGGEFDDVVTKVKEKIKSLVRRYQQAHLDYEYLVTKGNIEETFNPALRAYVQSVPEKYKELFQINPEDFSPKVSLGPEDGLKLSYKLSSLERERNTLKRDITGLKKLIEKERNTKRPAPPKEDFKNKINEILEKAKSRYGLVEKELRDPATILPKNIDELVPPVKGAPQEGPAPEPAGLTVKEAIDEFYRAAQVHLKGTARPGSKKSRDLERLAKIDVEKFLIHKWDYLQSLSDKEVSINYRQKATDDEVLAGQGLMDRFRKPEFQAENAVIIDRTINKELKKAGKLAANTPREEVKAGVFIDIFQRGLDDFVRFAQEGRSPQQVVDTAVKNVVFSLRRANNRYVLETKKARGEEFTKNEQKSWDELRPLEQANDIEKLHYQNLQQRDFPFKDLVLDQAASRYKIEDAQGKVHPSLSNRKKRFVHNEEPRYRRRPEDAARIPDPELARMITVARQSPGDWLSVALRFLSNYQGMTRTDYLKGLLWRFGINDISGPQIVNRKTNIRSKVSLASDKAAQRYPKLKRDLKPKDVVVLYNTLRSRKDILNPLSGFLAEYKVPSVARAGYENGLYAISLKEAYNEMAAQYGRGIADIFLQKATNLVAKHVMDFNKTTGKGLLHVRNPKEEDNTKLVFFSEGMTKKDFDESVLDLHNRLGGRYEGNAANESRNFAINIKKPDGSVQTVSKFNNVLTSFTRLADDITNISLEQRTLTDVVKILTPELSKRFNNALMDRSDVHVRAGINRIMQYLGDQYRDFNSLVKFLNDNPARRVRINKTLAELAVDLKLISEQLPAVVKSEMAVAMEKLRKGPVDTENVRIERNTVRNRGIDEFMSTEEAYHKFIDSDTRQQSYIDGDSYGTHNYAKRNADEQWGTFIEKVERARKNYDEPGPGTFEGIKKYGRSIYNFYKEKFTMWEGRKNMENLQKSLFRAQSAKERLAMVDSQRVMEDVYSEFVQTKMPGASKKDREQNFAAFNRLQDFLKEQEFKLWFEDETNYRLHPDLVKRLSTEPINFSGKETWDFDTWLKNPELITQHSVFQLSKATVDDLFISKILVQKLGIKADDLVEFFIRKNEVFNKPVTQMMSVLGEEAGMFKNLDFVENTIRTQEKIMRRIVAEEHSPELARTIDFTDPGDLKKVSLVFNTIKDPKARIDANFVLEHYVKFRPEKMAWVHHRILATPDGRKVYGSEINALLRDAEAGRVRGAKVLSPMADELMGRKVPTLLNLVERGYKIEMDVMQVEQSLLAYLYSRLYNRFMADGYKNQFVANLREKTKPVRDIEKKYKAVKESKWSDRKKYAEMDKLVAQKESILDGVIETMADMPGYFWKPVATEFSRAKTNKRRLQNRIDELNNLSERPEGEIARLVQKRDVEIKKLKDMHWILRLLSGYEFVKERIELINYFNKSPDPSLTKNADVRNQFHQDARKRQEIWRDKIMMSVTGNEQHIPFNWKAHRRDDRIGHRKFNLDIYNEHQVARGQPLIIRDSKKDRVLAPDVVGWEGLYFDRVVAKNFKQFLWRDDMSQQFTSYDFINKSMGAAQRVNSFFKVITLCKPTIMMANNAIQMSIGMPWAWGATKGAKNFQYAYRAFRDKHSTRAASEQAEFYWLMNKNNLFNHAVGVQSIMHDATRTWLKVMGENDFIGFKHYIAEVFRKKNPNLTPDGALGKAVDFIGQQMSVIGRGYKGYQELAWSIDEIMRMTMAKTMYDRLIRVHPKEHAAFLAAEWTNKHMVYYSQIPSFTRQIMNFFLMYPTYRVGTAEMYKEVFKNFAKGIHRAAGGTPKQQYIVSDNKWDQVLFEIGPFLRAIALRGAVKMLAMGVMGYGFENSWDAFTNYRAHKLVNTMYGEQYRYLSFSTPLFELEKYITRPLALTLKNNISAIPKLIWMLKTNTNPLNGKPLWTSPDKRKASQQLALELFRLHFPFGSDYSNFAQEDKSFLVKLFNFSGLGFAYDIENPKKLISDFYKAMSKTQTVGELRAAQRTFNANISRAYNRVFDKELKTMEEEIEQRQRLIDMQPL